MRRGRVLLRELTRFGRVYFFKRVERRRANDVVPDLLRHQLLGEGKRRVLLETDVRRERRSTHDEHLQPKRAALSAIVADVPNRPRR